MRGDRERKIENETKADWGGEPGKGKSNVEVGGGRKGGGGDRKKNDK